MTNNTDTFNNYSIEKERYKGGQNIVYQATEKNTNKKVLLKTPISETPSVKEIASIKYEYQVLTSLKIEGIPKAIGLFEGEGKPYLVIEDEGYTSLSKIITNKVFNFKDFLLIALKIIHILSEIHKNNYIHRDLKPSNILVNLESNEVMISDFGSAVKVSDEQSSIIPSSEIIGTIQYISPEQTGRTSRSINYRSDYYSLGITLYQVITNHLPFEYEDPLDIIHAHMVMTPDSPSDLNSYIPKMISDVIMKLIKKNPEDRYQSAFGIEYDLQKILEQIESKEGVKEFSLGEHDTSSVFHISEKLVGRTNEIKLLQESFERAATQHNEIIFISGTSGIGKTSLVNELKKISIKNASDFISVKFDKNIQVSPLQILGSAFSNTIEKILASGNDRIKEWSKKILTSVGNNGQILIENIPGIEYIIGKQPSIPDFEKENLESRIFNTTIQFLNLFSGPSKPLVIFLDDLQWANYSSLKFFKNLMISEVLTNILFIGTYRSNEVSEGHPLKQIIHDLESKLNRPLNTVILKELSEKDIEELILNSFKCDNKNVPQLANLCFKKTKGNPFYLKQFLGKLYAKKIFTYDTDNQLWIWDIQEINNLEVSDNIVDLLKQKIIGLPSKDRELIKLASCIGTTFNLNQLCRLDNLSRPSIIEILTKFQMDGFINVLEGRLELALNSETLPVKLGFSHAKIKESALSLINDVELPNIYYKLTKSYPQENPTNLPFETVETLTFNYNKAINLLSSDQEIRYAVNLNLYCTEVAINGSNYSAAYDYCQMAWNHYKRIDKKTPNDPLYLQLLKLLGDTQYLHGLHKEATKSYETLLSLPLEDVMRANISISKIKSHVILQEFNEALNSGYEVLNLLGLKIKPPVSKLKILITYFLFRLKDIHHTSLKRISDREATDEKFLLISEIFSSLQSAAILNNDVTPLILISLKIIEQAFKLGWVTAVQGSLNWIMGLEAQLGFYKDERELYKIERKWLDMTSSNSMLHVNKLMFVFFYLHKFEPIKNVIPLLREIYYKSYEIGELENAIVAFHQEINAMVFSGVKLYEIIRQIENNYSRVLDINEKDEIACIRGIYKGLSILWGKKSESQNIPDQIHVDEVNEYYNQGYKKVNFVYNIYALITATYMRNFKKAVEVSRLLEKLFYSESFVPGMILWTPVYYYSPLASIEMLRVCTEEEKAPLKIELKEQVKRLSKLSKIYPENLENKFALVKAEVEGEKGNILDAIDLYEQAIKLSKSKEFIHEEALSNELFCRFFLRLNHKDAAYGYLKEAIRLYRSWNAFAKIDQLNKEFSDLFVFKKDSTIEKQEDNYITNTNSISSLTLDIDSLQKAYRAIAHTIKLEDMMNNILLTIAQNTSAEKVVLILLEEDEFSIKGIYSTGGVDNSESFPIPYKNSKIIPQKFIDFSFLKKKPVISDDLSKDSRFLDDSYVIENSPLSALCFPLVKSEILSGAIYLENNLSTSVFTEKLMVLEILSGEIIPMLEVANSYKSIERFVPKDFLKVIHRNRISDVRLGDSTRITISTLFMDIRNFTTITESLEHEETFKLLNRTLQVVAPEITNNNGFIDKFIGDAVMALFIGSPDNALMASVGIIKALSEKTDYILGKFELTFKVGIGLSIGPATLGVLGSKERMDTTVISDSVNESSRLQSLNKLYGTSILISIRFIEALNTPENYNIFFLDYGRVKGKSVSIGIYEVFVGSPEELEERREFQKMFDYFWTLYKKKEFSEAKNLLMGMETKFPNQKITEVFLKRCEYFIDKGIPENWDGSFDL